MPQKLNERPPVSPVLDDAGTRRAHIRAVAAGLVDGPRMGRRFHVPAGVALQRSPRRRHHGAARRPIAVERRRGPLLRRVVGAALLLAQAGVLAALLTAPAFHVHSVDVTGDRLLSRGAVLAAARVPQASLFTVDGDAIRARLVALPWVRSATVSTRLPSTVEIVVTEWQPALLLRHGGTTTFVAANGATLGFTKSTASADQGVPLLLDYRSGAQQPLLNGFADLLARAAPRWTSAYGCTLDAFVLSSSGILSAWCTNGWQAIFGSLDSNEALAAIPQQLAVLAALRGRLDFAHPAFGYVDLENPATPSIGGHPGEPAALRADIAGSRVPSSSPAIGAAPATLPSPAPTLTPVATATPAPTPPASPSPLVFAIPPASSTGQGR
ncbi:MAG TPA: FtsQ-type POTRA domain-containing protein [Candidatus Dormibacteraeota bacterium]|nr:FtsQ-type POTRA domain-containing protein [Candidatus Dormibacteraeota bacterium]